MTTCEVTQKITEQDLGRFSGTSQYYRHNRRLFPNLMLSDGCHFLRKNAQCHWLFDAIASHIFHNKNLEEHRVENVGMFWELVVEDDDSATLTCYVDREKELDHQQIPYTDIGNYTDIKKLSIWTYPTLFGSQVVWVCLLPSEY